MKLSAPDGPGNRGIAPAWANLPRRRCDNCGVYYKPKRPLTKTQKFGFCKPACKDQFHEHGSAFIQVRDHITKEVAKQLKQRIGQLQAEVKELRAEINELRTLLEAIRCENEAPTGSSPYFPKGRWVDDRRS